MSALAIVISNMMWTELLAASAAVVTLLGVRLCWGASRYRMSIEERTKDGKLTEEQARRRISFMTWFGPAVALGGCAMLALVIWR